MNPTKTSVAVRLVALVALLVVTYNLILSHAALERSRTVAREAKKAFLEADLLYAEMGIYQLTVHPRPGSPLALEDFVQHYPSVLQDVKNWNGVGHFYFLGHVPLAGEPYAVYVLGDISIPDVREHPEWGISTCIRNDSVLSK